jgi:flagellum-specific peptidoglycan hydrolase FlgJ
MRAAPPELVAAVERYAMANGFGAVPLGLVLAQSALESAWWSSDVYVNGRNAFGLRLPRRRPTVAVGEYAGHARFSSVADSARDYWERQRAFGIPNTGNPAEYVAATVASGYATATNYGAAWLNVYRDRFADYDPPALVADGGPIVVALGLALFLASHE